MSRLDGVLLALACSISIIGSLEVFTRPDLGTRAAAAALCAALAILLLALMRRLQLALYAFIPLMTVVRIEPAPVDFMTIGLLGALAIRKELRTFVPSNVVLVAVAVLLLTSGASLAVTPSTRGFAFASATFLVIGMGYVAFELGSREPRLAERAFVLAAVVLALQTVVALSPLEVSDWMRQYEFRKEDGFRVQAFFKDPNVFGPFAIPAVLILCIRWPGIHPALRFIGLAAVIMPIVASLSRGAIVALAVSIVALSAVAGYRHLRRVLMRSLGIVAAGALGLALILALPGSSLAETKFTTVIRYYDISERLAGQVGGVNYALAHPSLLGIGPGHYERVVGQPSHETFIRLLVETGPLSLAALLILSWAAISLVRASELGAVIWASAAAGLMVCGLFIDTLHWRHLWVVLGLAFAAGPNPQGYHHGQHLEAVHRRGSHLPAGSDISRSPSL